MSFAQPTSPLRRGSLASQLLPRLVVIVAVMAIVVCASTLLGARAILMGQLDTELDSTQARQARGFDRPGFGSDIPAGIDAAGVRVGTIMAVQLDNGAQLAGLLADSKSVGIATTVQPVSDAAVTQLLAVPPDQSKHTLFLSGYGEYRVEARSTSTGGLFVIGLPTADISRSLVWLGLFAAGASLLATVVTGLVTREVLGRATRPLVALTNTATEVSQLELERGAVEVPRVADAQQPDTNEVTRLATAFNQMLDRVEGALVAREASEVKLRRFVADASHELRNPLAAIRGYAELAERAPAGTDSGHALGRIDAEAKRMSKLVSDLLMLARLDADATVHVGPVDVVEVVLNAVSDSQATSREHVWQLDLPESEIIVLADQDQLHQVMVNLLSNARTHTPPGTVVTTSVRRLPDRVQIDVSDNGPGIAPDTLPRVFERFTRADEARAHSASQSTGLGLAIVRAVVESFHGHATVSSAPGETVFRIELPLAAHLPAQA